MADIDPRWNTAAAESLSAWGISQASIDLVSHSENLVYRIETDNGTYGLRVHRPGYHTRQELISEQQWIAALANSGCSVPTPQPTLTGDGLATVTISGEAPRFASLVRWVNGYLLGSRLENAPRADRLRLIREIGVTNARLHAAASAWQSPRWLSSHSLECRRSDGGRSGLGPFLGGPTAQRRSERLTPAHPRPMQTTCREVVRSLVWLGWVSERADLFSSERLVQAIDLVCGEAAAHPQHP